jgi:F1F0 ATPase subunit 2
MNALTALTTGMGIALASMGLLWLTVRSYVRGLCSHAVLALSQVLRLSLAAAGFYAVSREGPGFLLPALAGFLIARRISICRCGGVSRAKP